METADDGGAPWRATNSMTCFGIASIWTAPTFSQRCVRYRCNGPAKGLGVNDSRVRQRRLAHTLWALDDGGTWVYPALQFEVSDDSQGTTTLKLVRGLDQVLPHLLTHGLHPTAIAGFLANPQPELLIGGQPQSVRDWLLHGEQVEPVLGLIDVARVAVM
jgi:hypothetical protein